MESEQDTMVVLPVIGHLTFREAHAFIDGVYSGVKNKEQHGYSKEKHYWRSGWLLGDFYHMYFRDRSE